MLRLFLWSSLGGNAQVQGFKTAAIRQGVRSLGEHNPFVIGNSVCVNQSLCSRPLGPLAAWLGCGAYSAQSQEGMRQACISPSVQ